MVDCVYPSTGRNNGPRLRYRLTVLLSCCQSHTYLCLRWLAPCQPVPCPACPVTPTERAKCSVERRRFKLSRHAKDSQGYYQPAAVIASLLFCEVALAVQAGGCPFDPTSPPTLPPASLPASPLHLLVIVMSFTISSHL